MHSFTAPSGRTYHHNGDFSGGVKVPVGEMPVSGFTIYEDIPMADLVALVASMIRRQKIREIEDMDDAELIGRLALH